MAQKKATCPHCSRENIYTEPDWDDAIMEKLPVSLAKAFGVTVFTVLTGGLGGLIVGGALYADNVIRYMNGVAMNCSNCGNEFKVS